MTAMNVVHMRAKPGMEDERVRLHREMDTRSMPGARNLWLVRSGERSFIVVAEWERDGPEIPGPLADERRLDAPQRMGTCAAG